MRGFVAELRYMLTVCDGITTDVSRSSHSRLVNKLSTSSSSSSSSSVVYQPLQSLVTVTAANVISASPVFPRQSQPTTDDAHFHWSPSTAEQDQRLSQVATGDGPTSLQQVLADYQLVHHQATPAITFIGSSCGANSVLLAHQCEESPDMKHDSFLVHDHPAVDGYNLECKDDVRSYVNLMTSGTLGGSGGFTNGHFINYVTNDACCSE